MKFNKVFDDEVSKSLYKQIHKVSTYIHEQLEKSVTKQLLLRVLERNLLPILVYPEREPMVMPMSYSQQRDRQVNIHSPIPELKLLNVREYCELFDDGLESFHNQIYQMKQRVEKLDP